MKDYKVVTKKQFEDFIQKYSKILVQQEETGTDYPMRILFILNPSPFEKPNIVGFRQPDINGLYYIKSKILSST